MGEINQNLTGRSLRAFLIDDPVGATSQIIIDFNALFRKLRLVPSVLPRPSALLGPSVRIRPSIPLRLSVLPRRSINTIGSAATCRA